MACEWLLIGHKSEKWQLRHNLLAWRHPQIFFEVVLFLLSTFIYWSKFHVNIIIGFGVMIISFCKERNSEIRNTPVWVLPNILRMGRVRDIKFEADVSKEMLANATKCQSYSFYRFWVIKRKPTRGGGFKISPPPPPYTHTPIRVKKIADITLKDRLENIFRNNIFQYRYILLI